MDLRTDGHTAKMMIIFCNLANVSEKPYHYISSRNGDGYVRGSYLQTFCVNDFYVFCDEPTFCRGPNSSVGIGTVYGLDGPGIESRWGGQIFRTCPDLPWGPPSLLYNGYRVFPGGKDLPGRDADSSPPSSDVGHERLELYLYSSYGPYGLYRASVELYLYSSYGPYGLYRASAELYLYCPYGPYGLYRASV